MGGLLRDGMRGRINFVNPQTFMCLGMFKCSVTTMQCVKVLYGSQDPPSL